MMFADLTAEAFAAGPLTFDYPLDAATSIRTTVHGDARQYATVSIIYGALNLWSQTLTQLAHIATIPDDIVAGEITVEAGGKFTLTVPTSLRNGSVAADLKIKTATQEFPFKATVASWPLNSADN